MKNFKELPSNSINNGIQYIFKADNGYGASIVQHDFSYGGKKGLWELAVIKYDEDGDWDICYDTPITNDVLVLGHLDESEVMDYLTQIEQL
jgi:hypothetical protein